jgi:hypothetical protein
MPTLMSSTAAPVPADPEPLDQAAQRKASALVIVILLVAAIGCVILWHWTRADEPTAIRALPTADRRALFEGTLRTLQSVCDAQRRPPGLDGFCNEQAIFVEQFPECEAVCRALAKAARTQPTR